MIRVLAAASAALLLVSVPPASADSATATPTTACEFTIISERGSYTSYRSFPDGSFTATENPRRANTAPGGVFSFALPNPTGANLAPLTVTRVIEYRSSNGKIRTVKRINRISGFDTAGSANLRDIRLAGTFVSQKIAFVSPRSSTTSYRCDHLSPNA